MSKRKSGSLSERHNKRVRPAEDEDEEEDDGGISDDQNDPLLSQVWTCIFKQSFKAFVLSRYHMLKLLLWGKLDHLLSHTNYTAR